MCALASERNETERIFDGVYYPEHARPKLQHSTGAWMSDPANYAAGLELHAGGIPLSEADLEHMRDHYDGGALAADFYVGALLDALPENTVVIVTSDHGEDLQQHGVSNHRAVIFDSTTRVPFVVLGLGEGVREDLVSSADVVPTLMALAGSVPPAGSRGRDLFDSTAPEWVFQQGVMGQSALRTETRRLVLEGPLLDDPAYLDAALDPGRYRLYDLVEDPLEHRPIEGDGEALRDAMLGVLADMERSGAREAPSEEVIQAMKARGYW